ncbi:MAG: hypothetical protein ACRELD_04995, partial [Longimicrobiales bacterium]
PTPPARAPFRDVYRERLGGAAARAHAELPAAVRGPSFRGEIPGLADRPSARMGDRFGTHSRGTAPRAASQPAARPPIRAAPAKAPPRVAPPPKANATSKPKGNNTSKPKGNNGSRPKGNNGGQSH